MPVTVGRGGLAFGAEPLVDGVEANLGGFMVDFFGVRGEDRHEGGVGSDRVHAGPGFGGSAAPGGVD